MGQGVRIPTVRARLSICCYEPIGSAPGLDEEKEVTFDTLQELGKFLKENPGLAEKVGYS